MLTAPSGPMTAISAVGQARLRSPRMCLLLMTSVGAAIGFARDHGQLGHGRFAVGIEQLGAGADDPAMFLDGAGQEARHIHEGDDRHVEASQKRMKRAAFSLALISSTPARTTGWLATMPTLCPPRRAKPTTILAA